ncbi:MAG: TolC family protein [Oscillospiraceae bacterium]|nr:TolC family protein [Oscillospiraceae bacterium]
MKKKLSAALIASLLIISSVLTPVCAVDAVQKSTDTGKITWETLEERVRAGSLSAQALEENIGSIETIDYTYLYNTMQKQLNELSAAQSFLLESGDREKLNSLNSTMASLRNTYEDIRDGKLQRDSKDAANQLRDMQNRVVIGTQSLYINILSLEQSLRDGERGLEALERTLTELRLRHTLGQVSAIKVAELERARDDTQCQLDTLKTTISSLKAQLQLLIGEAPTGEAELSPLPEINKNSVSESEHEANLIIAKEKSVAISSSKIALEKAEEEVSDKNSDYLSGSIKRYELTIAEHSKASAELSYRSEIQNFEYAFNELSRTLENSRQVLENKKAASVYQQKLLEISEKQYALGRISYFALLSARDNAESAVSAVSAAERDLFTAYNNYSNAVKYGITD